MVYQFSLAILKLCNHSALNISSVTQLCLTICDPMDCSTPGLPVLHSLLEFAQLISIESVVPSNHLILCCPLLLLPSVFPCIRVFSSEPALHIRWQKYWSFSFSIPPSNEYLGLVSFRINWFAHPNNIKPSENPQVQNIKTLLGILYQKL